MSTSWTSRSPLVLAVIVVAGLVASAVIVMRTVGSAREGTARDAGEASVVALRERIRAGTPLDSAGLAELVEDERGQGLRYVAWLGDDNRVLASAGTPYGMTTDDGTFEELDDRVRMVRRLPLWRGGRRGGQRGSAAGGSGVGGSGGSDPGGSGGSATIARTGSGSDAAASGGGATGGGSGAGAGSNSGLSPRRIAGIDQTVSAVVIEFEPLVANQLRSDVRILFAVAAATSLVVLGFALWTVRGARQRDKLQTELERGRRLAALGEMSSVIAHEVRNPLASLKGHAQLLVETLPDTGPQRAKADRVVAEAARLERLTTDLLEFVRSGEIKRSATDARALVDDAVGEVGAGRVDVTAGGELGGWAIDPARMRQAIVNVIQNAVQASPPDRRVDVAVDGGKDALVIAVRDRGPGIPAGEERTIFEPFHTKRTKGIGLGLAIARRMVELHGGSIAAGARTGGGAEVTITVPRRT